MTDAMAPDDEAIDGYNQYGIPYIDMRDAHGTFVRCLEGIVAKCSHHCSTALDSHSFLTAQTSCRLICREEQPA